MQYKQDNNINNRLTKYFLPCKWTSSSMRQRSSGKHRMSTSRYICFSQRTSRATFVNDRLLMASETKSLSFPPDFITKSAIVWIISGSLRQRCIVHVVELEQRPVRLSVFEHSIAAWKIFQLEYWCSNPHHRITTTFIASPLPLLLRFFCYLGLSYCSQSLPYPSPPYTYIIFQRTRCGRQHYADLIFEVLQRKKNEAFVKCNRSMKPKR